MAACAEIARAGTGRRLTIARVTLLDRDGFAQEPAGVLRIAGTSGAVHGPPTPQSGAGPRSSDFLS